MPDAGRVGAAVRRCQGIILGWASSVLGIGGIAALLVLSVKSQWGDRPTYDNFLAGIFFFFVSLGILVGVPVGMSLGSVVIGACASMAGLVAGYALGIFSGLWAQRIGWMALAVNALAGIGAIILGLAAIILALVLVVG